MGWNKEKHLSDEHKRKISESLKGHKVSKEARRKISESLKSHPSWNKGLKGEEYLKHFKNRKLNAARIGKPLSDKHKQKIGDALRGKLVSEETKRKMSKNNARYWKGKKFPKEHAQKIREARKYQPTHHTKPELKFEEICKKYNLPYRYVGDGKFWIENINPDFVESNGKKIAVEIFGNYWHSPLLNPKLREDRTLPYREKTLKKYGWKLIVFWEDELKNENAEKIVMNRTMNFRGK